MNRTALIAIAALALLSACGSGGDGLPDAPITGIRTSGVSDSATASSGTKPGCQVAIVEARMECAR
ncbi:MAG TPA: hypothetical protein PK177_13985 [Burkholderiaceae bacterium]|nr:hypothetical protein [Burkholderiaceae bacterium]